MSADHYFTAEPDAPLRRSEIEFSVAGKNYRLVVASGVFSAGRLDPGTAVLLRKATLPTVTTEGTLLDLGCGYGPITCVLATEAPQATVWAVDVNSRARELTTENTKKYEKRVKVAEPGDVPADITFDEIWSNPPTHVGKAELHVLMERWLPRLAPAGTAWLVINRNLGGDSLHTWLTGLGWQVERIASQRGFRVLRVTRNSAD
ncbi:class I SAM-dependent methyltransferase [Actinoplanes sp. CA-015351]|uniref:class I SAM-dependent methyltransferase n=1 Tax=Actinoplanes sp. CA-015351 TaxID=3239897 RepID=UPI003D978666